MKNPKVAILMSTFNGSKYIIEQIDSIINQDYEFWELYIRDDGSNDNTIQIILEYEKKYPNIHLVLDSISHRGVRDSFMFLLSYVDSEYYMFCDQDDVWLPSKISTCLNKIINIKSIQSKPILVCCDLEVVDEKLNMIYPSLWEKYNLTNLVKFASKSLIVAPMFQGCTMLFNNAAKEVTLNIHPFSTTIHDNHLTMCTVSVGGDIIPIYQPLIKYRQHSSNVEGALIGSHIKLKKLFRIKNVIKKSKSQYLISNYYLNTSLFKYLLYKLLYIVYN